MVRSCTRANRICYDENVYIIQCNPQAYPASVPA